MLQNICDILDKKSIRKIQKNFNLDELDKILGGTMQKEFPPAAAYIEGITGFLFQKGSTNQHTLGRADKEKIILGLLAAAGATANLTTHIYIAIADKDMKISVEDIGNIILLAGVYMGVDRLSGGLRVLQTSLETMKQMVENKEDLSPLSVISALSKRYGPEPMPGEASITVNEVITVKEASGSA